MKKELYPMKFTPIPSVRVWGGDYFIKNFNKTFYETDGNGQERKLTTADKVAESWELADMGEQESVVVNGWLAGNTMEDIMETYMDRITGQVCFDHYGTLFPLLIKYLDINDKLSVQVHPDDEIARERYDSLGKNEVWYIMDTRPDAVVYMGFKKKVSASELYERCKNGTVNEILNEIHPRKGDAIFIKAGTVHAANGVVVAEIQESSDLSFRLYDWGREFNPATARKMHLEEAIDFINYEAVDMSLWKKGPLWEDGWHPVAGEPVRKLVQIPEFTINELHVDAPLQISTSTSDNFLVYMCLEGKVRVGDVPVVKGETVLVPADMKDFVILPLEAGSILLEGTVERYGDADAYINPDTEPFLPGEDYEGLDKE